MPRSPSSSTPRLAPGLALGLVVALAAGCPNQLEGEDAGVTPDDDAGTQLDAGNPGQDAGVDAGDPPDAGDDDEDAGAPGDEDAGPEEPHCVVEDPCEGVAVTGQVRFEPGASSTNAFGPAGAATLVVGQSTRADVEAAFGAAVPTDNPFRGWHCAYGVRVEYVDDLDGDEFEGNGSAGDVVARVVTLPGVDLSNAYGVTPGQARADAQAALTDPLSLDVEGTGFDASASDGLSVVSTGGVVTTVALFRPQALSRWDLSVDVPAAAIGTAPSRLAYGEDLSEADDVLGTNWDAQGLIEVNALVRVLVRIYASYGIRVAALCPIGGSCNAGNATIQQIVLSPPFVGGTSSGLHLGSAEAGFTAAFGAGVPSEQSEDLLVYELGARDLGVAYVRDASCTRRAAALLLGFREL